MKSSAGVGPVRAGLAVIVVAAWIGGSQRAADPGVAAALASPVEWANRDEVPAAAAGGAGGADPTAGQPDAAAAPAGTEAAGGASAAAVSDPQAVEFFERRVRPLLIKRCHECHALGAQSEGGLVLTSREALLAGGGRGAALVPGHPERSLLIEAVGRGTDLKMPPDEPLAAEEIADLENWIRRGAVWPQTAVAPRDQAAAGSVTDEDRRYWAFQPPSDPPLPAVSDTRWPQSPVDHFILAELEKRGLRPAPPADKATLLRRVTFDLTGLPPTPEEIAAFLADQSPEAYRRVVARLLDSPRYGERWARKWLDLVRYGDTNGIDNDEDKPNAYRYRDYVIEAFNRDVPYDQFVREHIAGDLLPEPRRTADGQQFASPLGTAFYWLGEMLNAPADPAAARAAELENRIDVLGKTFLGLTLACARCHDHKFDPIPTSDYYALAGFLTSSTNLQKCVDTPQRKAEISSRLDEIARLAAEERRLLGRVELARRWAESRRQRLSRLEPYFLAAQEAVAQGQPSVDAAARRIAAGWGLDADKLAALAARFDPPPDDENSPKDPLFFPWQSLLGIEPGPRYALRAAGIGRRWTRYLAELPDYTDGPLFEDFESPRLEGWQIEGEAFAGQPQTADESVFPTGPRWAGLGGGFLSSWRSTHAATGRITTPRFKVDKPYLAFRIAGGNRPGKLGVNLIFESQVLPEPDDVQAIPSGTEQLEWRVFNLRPYQDHEVFLEFVDEDAAPGGELVVDELRFTEIGPLALPWVPNRQVAAMLQEGPIDSPRGLVDAYRRTFSQVLDAWVATLDEYERQAAGGLSPAPPRLEDPDQAALLKWVLADDSILEDEGLVGLLDGDEQTRYRQLVARRQALEESIPTSTLAIVAADAQGADQPIQYRGSPKDLGPLVPRRFLQAAYRGPPPAIESGSGRLPLADWLASPDNPLTARVIVNRLWLAHFGRGIVPTPDNFGRLGEPPANLPLLDFLAARLVEENWSLKALHRLLVLSAAYQQSHVAYPRAVELDPQNALVHHQPIQRLDAECIRDAILAASGSLSEAMHGPGVPTHLEEFMKGEDLPAVSGPLDGYGRRTIYLEVRRNHVMQLLRAFDFPRPETTVGLRPASLVPGQALVLMNSAFVANEARRWARRLLAGPADESQRIETIYLRALGRRVEADELAAAQAFLRLQREAHRRADQAVATQEANRQPAEQSPQAGADQAAAGGLAGYDGPHAARPDDSSVAETEPADCETRAWADLCHVIFNLAEFVHVR